MMWTELYHRARALLRRTAVEKEMDDELRFHLSLQVEKHLAAGLNRDQAERQARLDLGGMEQVKEECREARGVTVLETILRDLRHASRGLRRSPGFAAVVVLSLGLGIGGNTAIFTLIDAVMLRMLPVEDPQHLLLLARNQGGDVSPGFTYQEYTQLRDDGRFFTALAAYAPARLRVSVDGGNEPTAAGQLVSGRYFGVLGVRPIAGRAIGPEDDRIPDAHPVAMISDGYWKRRFAREPGAVGRTISIGGRRFTVIGVTPPEFFGVEVGAAPDLFVPLMMQPTVLGASENLLVNPILRTTWLRTLGRLRPGVSAAQVSALEPVLARVNTVQGGKRPPPGMRALPPERLTLLPAATGFSELRQQFSQPLLILLAMVAVVLLISCANVANLLLSRAATRRQELSMRLALGASRGRLVQQLLVESVLLALLGGACGLLFAAWASRLLVAFMSAGRTPIVLDLAPDPRVLAFTAIVSVATGILFGLAPAWGASRIDLGAAMKAQPRLVGGQASARAGRALVVSQVALCVLLLFGAGLFVRSLQKLDAQAAGVARESVLVVRVEPRGSNQRNAPGTSSRLDRTYRDLLAGVRTLPNVRAASLASDTPTSVVRFRSPIKLPDGTLFPLNRLMVYPGYFQTLGLPLLAGRDFEERDLQVVSPPLVVVVNEAFARKAFPGESPVGKRLLTSMGGSFYPCEIIGLVRDTRLSQLRGEPLPLAYQPFLQTSTGRGQMVLHVRSAGPPAALMAGIRDQVQRMDPALPLFEVHTLAQEVDGALVRERLIATLSGFFGALALLLACVGLYGVMAFAVEQRTGEMGLRMALGARRGNVVWMMMRQALLLVVFGLLLGVPAALVLGRVTASQIAGLLFGLQSTDPETIAAAVLVMAAAATIASYLPARRASRVDLMVALRSE
jgi:macrolide transport system ATP-binding/permease protein